MDGPGVYYAKWNKPVRERQVPCDLNYIWNLMNQINKQTKKKQTHRYREQTELSGGGSLGTGWKDEGIKRKPQNS